METSTILIIGGVAVVGVIAYFLLSPGSQSGSITSPLPDLGGAGFLNSIASYPGQDWLTNFETAGSDLINSGKKTLDKVTNLLTTTEATLDKVKTVVDDTTKATIPVIHTLGIVAQAVDDVVTFVTKVPDNVVKTATNVGNALAQTGNTIGAIISAPFTATTTVRTPKFQGGRG
jgi:uncharacterized protein YoxC